MKRLVFLVLVLSGICLQAIAKDEVAGVSRKLVERVVKDKADRFKIEPIPTVDEKDVFEIESRGGYVVLRGNSSGIAAFGPDGSVSGEF